MKIKFNLAAVSLFAASLLSSVASASAGQWYFYIENGSDSKLVQALLKRCSSVAVSSMVAPRLKVITQLSSERLTLV